jgi:hypothetical protein
MTATAIGSYATATALKTLANISGTSDDTLIGLICDRVNQFIESETHRVLAPISSATYVYDGDGCNSLYLPTPPAVAPIGGLRAITLLELAYYTGGAYTTVASTDYFLRQQVGMTGPFERLYLSDIPTSGFLVFPRGFATVRITATAGWAAIPDDITELALVVAQRAWNAREVGFQDVAGHDEQGRPYVARFLSGRDRATLARYTLTEAML